MADIREERIKRLQEIMSRRQDFASGKTVSDEETNNRIQTLDRVYNQRYLPQQADSWTSDFTAFAKKIQTDAQSRANKYQSQDSLTAYRDSISGQLSDLIDRSKYAKKYAESSGNTAYQSYVDESIKYLTDIAGSLQKEQEYWGQWADEDAYKNSANYFRDQYGDKASGYKAINNSLTGNMVSMGSLFSPDKEKESESNLQVQEVYNKYTGRDYVKDTLSIGVGGGSYEAPEFYVNMLYPEERSMYLWLYDNVGKEEADRYYKSMIDTLTYRTGEAQANNIERMAGGNQTAQDALNALYAFPAGVNSGVNGIIQYASSIFSDEALPQSPTAIAHQLNREKGSDFGNVFTDLSFTTGNMTPAIVASSLVPGGGGQVVGAAVTALSSGGNSYADARRQGYTHEQALTYGTINGILEGGLQYALGGIGKLGGKAGEAIGNKLGKSGLGQKVAQYVANIKNESVRAFVQNAGSIAGHAASEFTEESLQAIIDPMIRNLTLGEQNSFWDSFTSGEVLYSGLLGALSAGLLEGPHIIMSRSEATKIGKQAFENGSWKGAIDYAMLLDPESKVYSFAKALNEGTIKADANNVGTLYEYLSDYIRESKTLIRKGKMTTDQYVSAQKAIAQIYEARTQAETKVSQGTETAQNNVSANVLNNDIYNAVKAVQANEKAAVRQANIIARILNGDSSVSSAQIDEVSGKNSSVRNILKSATGIDLGITNADARKAVKAYISEKAAAVNVQQTSAQAQESNPEMTAQQTEYDETVKESDKLSAVFGEKGQAAYKEFSKGMKLSDSLLYFNDAFIRFYNQGVEAASKKNSPNKYRDINGFEGISSLIKQRAYEAGLADARNKSGTIAEFVQKAHEVTEKAAQDEKEIKERQKAAKKVAAKQFSVDELAPTAGKWNVDPKIDTENLSEKQSASLNYLKTVSEVSGMNITLMSGIDANGDFSVENGYYDGTTNTVYVSINAGMQSIADITHSAMLKTAAHEITHYIAKSGTDAYTMLEDYIVNEFIMEYGKDGLARRISDIQEAYKDALNKDLTYEKAKEEMVANACEMMLKNSNTFEKLAMNNMTLAQKLKAGLDSFMSKFNSNKNAALEGLEATSLEARMLARSESSLKTAQKLWDNALKGAIKENQNKVPDSKVTNETTEAQNKNVMQNLRTMTEDYWEYRNDTVLKGLLTSKEYDTLFNTINVIMDKARKNPDILDFGADIDSNNRPFSSIKSNSDPLYKVSLDFSTLCRKRLLQQAITNRLQAKLKRSLTAKEQTAIRNELVKLRKEGKKIEVACALCYVEAARLKSPKVINDFLDNRRKYAIDYFSKKNNAFNDTINKKQGDYLESKGLDRDTKKSDMPKNISSYLNKNKPLWRQQYTPTAYETEAIKVLESMDAATMLSPQGLAQLKLNNPVAYDIFISRVRTATKSKAQETNVAFKRGDSYGFIDGSGNATVNISDALIEEMNKENGLRYQSWSDFQAFHILDNIAAVMELATRNAKMQTYTKVPDFVMLNGKTGMMINMSLIAKGEGLNADGTFAFNDIEGMSYAESVRLRDMFPDTAGNIVVAVNDAHLKALLNSNDIDYVIPYHLSGLNKDLRLMMSIEQWVDYTRKQNERKIDTDSKNTSDKNWHKSPKFSEWFDEAAAAKAEDGYAFMREAAQKYISLCEERGLEPKFNEFKTEQNYWKLLIDRKMVNQITGKVIVQQAVKPIFDENAISIADKAVSDTQAIKDFREVQDSLVEQILSGDVKISRKMTAELNAMQTSLLTSDMNNGAETETDGRMFELRTSDNGTKYALVTEDISKIEVSNNPDASLAAKARYILNKRFRNTVLDVSDNDKVYINRGGINEYTNPAKRLPDDLFVAKLGASAELNDLLKTAKNIRVVDDDGRHHDAVRGWKYYDIVFAVANSNSANKFSVFSGKLNIKRIAKGELFHDITEIKEITNGTAGQDILSSISAGSIGDNNSIFDIAENVNTENEKNSELRYDDTAFDPRRELPDALLELAQNEKERNTLLRYKENADMLNKVQLSLEQAYAELKQAKAAMDGKRMREASDAVKKAENRLNIWDKKLTEMEATKPIKELIARRERQLKEQFARGSTTRAKYRNNIKKNIRSLDAKLRTNSGQKHILKELQPVIASLLDTFTNNTSVFTRDQLEKLKYAYAQFKPDSNMVTDADNTIINEYDGQDYENDPHLYMEHYAPVIADSINAIAPVIENMRLTDLDAETLAVLDNIVSNINHIVVHSEDIFINKKATELRDIAESSLADMKQSGYTRPKLDENGTASTIKSFFEYKNTLPVYVMERLGDTVMNKLWNPLQNGAAQMVREQVSDSEFLHSMMKKYDMQDWKDDTLRVTLESGQQIVVTQEQAMYIYAVAKRENTHRGIGGKRINHLGSGGIILPKIVKENIVNEETGKTEKYLGVIPKKRKVLADQNGIPLTDADIDAISKRLSANQKNYVDEIVSYLSTTIADRGNEVSRQLYGIDLFNEKYYIPIMSSKDYLNISFMGQTEKLIKNAGMTKALTQGANNPIVIDDFSTVVAQHLLQMERYDSLAVPLDNFNRWLNYLSYDEDAKGRRTKNGDGVRVTMEDVYGAEMQQYINQLLKDANAASTKSNNENLANRLIGKFRKNAVLASLSVAIQQPSALGRAFTYISPKYFAFRTGWTHFKDNFNEMMKYADTAFIKENGSFDPAVSTNALDDMLYMSPEGWNKVWKLFSKDGKYRDELLGKLPKAMDRITWVSIWQAVKAETADKYGNLDTNSDEFLKIAGERFDYIINRTQVYDSILSKSELMRSKSAWWKSVTSFAAEPTVAYNVLLKGAEEVSLAKGQDAKAKRTAWRFFGRSVASFLTASFFNSLLKSIVTAARKDKDDDKSYLEWYAQEFVSNFIDDSSVFKLLPLIRDVASLFEGYDLTRTDMEMVTMIKDAVEAIADSDLPVGDKLTEIIKAVGIMTGIPAENIMRDTKALYNVIVDIFDGWQTSWEGIGDAAHDAIAGVTRFDWISESASTEDKLYAAMMNGDKNAYSKYYSMIEQEFNKKPKGSYKSAESYMRSEIRKRLKESEEIKKIYEARMALDLKTYNAIKQELMDKGFIENDIMSAVNLYKEALEKEQEQQESEVQNTTEPEEEKAYFDKDLLITALEKNNGSDVEIIEQMIGDYSNKRDPEYLERRKKIRSYITGYLKPKYQDAFLASDGAELRRIAQQLQQYKKYGINYTSDDLLQWRKSAKADRQ